MAGNHFNDPFDLARISDAMTIRGFDEMKSAYSWTDPLRDMHCVTSALHHPAMPGNNGLRSGNALESALMHESQSECALREDAQLRKMMSGIAGVAPLASCAAAEIEILRKKLDEAPLTAGAAEIAGLGAIGESFRALNEAYPAAWREMRDAGAGRMLDMLEEANRHWQKLCEPVSAVDRFMKEEEARQNLPYGFSSQLYRTGTLFAGLDYDAMSLNLGIKRPFFTAMENVAGRTVRAYDDMILSCQSAEDTGLPDHAVPGATRGLHLLGCALNCLQPADAKEAVQETVPMSGDAECIELLGSANPALLRMYLGALECRESGNSDKTRQIFISLRGLLETLIRDFTPKADVLAWIREQKSPKDLVDDNGKPTRQARYRFMAKGFDNPTLAPLLDASHLSFNAFFKILNGVHNPELKFSEDEISFMISLAEFHIKFLLKTVKRSD